MDILLDWLWRNAGRGICQRYWIEQQSPDLSVRKRKRAEKNHIEYDEIKGNEHNGPKEAATEILKYITGEKELKTLEDDE